MLPNNHAAMPAMALRTVLMQLNPVHTLMRLTTSKLDLYTPAEKLQ